MELFKQTTCLVFPVVLRDRNTRTGLTFMVGGYKSILALGHDCNFLGCGICFLRNNRISLAISYFRIIFAFLLV